MYPEEKLQGRGNPLSGAWAFVNFLHAEYGFDDLFAIQ